MSGHFKVSLPFNGLQNAAGICFPPAPKAFLEPQVSGFMRPVRFEGEINNLEIIGDIPEEIKGTFYRVMPEPQFPSFIPNDPWFNGDGNISAFRIQDGHVDFKQRYVRTEKFVREAQARKALLGKYRNKYTDAVAFQIRSTANTNIVYWQGKLLALKEDSPPYAMDPETLETIGLWDFDGQLPSLTFTAHPKFDPKTREMVCFGYEAKGDGTPDVCYYSIDPNGKFLETVWLVAPVVGMMHDFAVTENFVILPINAHICDVERLKAGGEHWQYDNDCPLYIGVLPRRGAKSSDVKWFRGPNGFPGHVANAFETENGEIELQMGFSDGNGFFWWPDKDGKAPYPGQFESSIRRWKIDYKSDDLSLGTPEIIVSGDVEFPRIDDRLATRTHSKMFFSVMNKQAGTDMRLIGPVMGGGHPLFNGIGAYSTKTKIYEEYFAGPRKLCQEGVFLPRNKNAKEGDGYVMALLNNYEEMCSELVILDTTNFTKEVALIKLPVRLRAGLHGNWVDNDDVDGHPASLP